MARTSKDRVLFFFRAALGDFYYSFPLFEYFQRKHANDLTYICASPLALDLLYLDGRMIRFFDRSIPFSQFRPERIYSRVYNLDFNQTGVSALHVPKTSLLQLLEKHHDASFDWENLDSIYRLKFPTFEMQEVNDILKRYALDSERRTAKQLYRRRTEGRNIVIHTTHSDKFPYGKTPTFSWWKELVSYFPQHRFFQVGTTRKLASRIVPDYDLRQAGQLENVIDLRDRLNLRQVAYLLEHTDFHITVDSVVAHLSRHSKTPGITLWGSSDKKLLGHEHNHHVDSSRPCSPCIDLDSNKQCCLKNNNELFPTPEAFAQKLKEHFSLLLPPKPRSQWLISSNKKNVKQLTI